ncbi:MAG: hypothetical protein M1837_001941 [Sclerophora amabilis]|nr:MAG: hypothetical protein M1837_001941 [Sclerophora amabilis]
MGKKKRGHPDAEEILNRPWCYYCERDFDDLKILISHQKAKHFKCDRCGRRLNTAGGLSVHLNQVHKETLTTVENALPNRSNLDVEIFGMEGIPEDVITAHNQRVYSQFQSAEAERRVATGNPPSGAGANGGAKKAKFESPSELKKRLAEHKAKMAEQGTGGNSGAGTPIGAGHGNLSPSLAQSPSVFAGSPTYSQSQQGQIAPNNTNYSSFPQPVNHQGGEYHPPQPIFAQPQHQGFLSPGVQQYSPPNQPPFPPPQQHPLPGSHGGAQFQGGLRPYGAGSPPLPFQQNHQQPLRTQTPPQNGAIPPRPGSLPPAVPGLPQRPSFGAPSVNAFQMQQLHQGQVAPQAPNSLPSPAQQQHSGAWGPMSNGNYVENGQNPALEQGQQPSLPKVSNGPDISTGISTSLDDLVSAAKRATDVEAKPSEEVATEKKSKKEKDKPTRLIFSDNEVSPEEKMASLPRYAFVPTNKQDTVLGDATTAAVAGVPTGPDDVLDAQG